MHKHGDTSKNIAYVNYFYLALANIERMWYKLFYKGQLR